MEKMFFLSGLPRTGSTLLSAILSQNPDVYAGGNSALCQILWDAHVSVNFNAIEQLLATNKHSYMIKQIKKIPSVYYEDVKNKYVLDKCRSWTIQPNIDLLTNYVDNSPKIIVMVRNIEEIVKSFIFLYQKNNKMIDVDELLNLNSEPLMRSFDGVINSFNDSSAHYHYVSYEKLINNTKEIVSDIYKFLEVPDFKNHDFNNIKILNKENDNVYGLQGMHDVREKIQKRDLNIKINSSNMKKINELNKKISHVL